MKLLTKYRFLVYFLFCTSLFSCKPSMIIAFPTGNETDRLALIEFRERITQDPHDIMRSWNESLHVCDWQGVSCNNRHYGRVAILNLEGKKLTGMLPPHIGNLSFLRAINLDGNFFQGAIPQEIGKLLQLRFLNLSNNAFQGEIPSNLSNCSNLKVIHLNANKLVGKIPFEFTYLSSKNLREFYVFDNNLTGNIPIWLGNATSLVKLSLRRNRLEGTIPSEFGRLSNLRFLSIAQNNISGEVPLSIYNLSSLEYLDITENFVEGKFPSNIGSTLFNLLGLHVAANYLSGLIPESLTNASKLETISLAYNTFTGTVPLNLGNLKDLQKFGLAVNNIENEDGTEFSFLTSLTNCTKLQVLDIGYNYFTGELPSSIANFSDALQVFSVSGNYISGTIPEGIEALSGLEYLLINENNIRGKIPTGIGKLQKMGNIMLYKNKISGAIPSSIGNLTQLLRLELSSNDLEGSIPPSLGECGQLQYIWLDRNRLTGDLPKEIASMSSTITFNISQNFFTGVLPPEIGNKTKLTELDISGNILSGVIPISIGSCEMLEELRLEDNSFNGTIPSTLSNLKSIRAIDLSKNNLSGNIPAYFQNITLLKYLNLSYNNLEGEVPQEGIFKNQSAFFIDGNEKLCGGLKSLALPACQFETPKGKGFPLVLKIVIPTSLSCLILIASLHLISRRRKKTQPSSSINDFVDKHFPKVSYAELSEATNGFSPTNLIGQGAHGSVYRGILANDGLSVAVKVLNLTQKGASKSFMAECIALKNIRHRNLVKIITVCSSINFKGDDFKALVFELMPSGSLDEWLHGRENSQLGRGKLSLTQRIIIASDITCALEYLHNGSGTSVVHGDLKPSNILLDHEMNAHVGDFGLARVLSTYQNDNASSQNPMSSTGLKGTVGYIAPEYGRDGRLSLQGDVYSFGIMLLEMFTGKKPTDDIFQSGMNLHQHVKMALPDRVAEILEPSILVGVEGNDDDAITVESSAIGPGEMVKCVCSILEIGIACSMESPVERMSMKDVVVEINKVKNKCIGIGSQNRGNNILG